MSVQEPLWNSVFCKPSKTSVNTLGQRTKLDASLTGGFGEDVADLVDLGFGEVTSASVGVDLGNFAGQDGESPADTLDNSEGEADLVLSVDVRVHHTEEVLELVGARQDESR